MAYNDKREQQVWRPQGDQSADVSNKIVLPEVEDNSAKLLQESTPQGKPFVSAMDKARIRSKVDPVSRINAITNDTEVENTLAKARETAINEYNADKAQRDKEAKEKADAEAKEAEEAKHRKAEKMWSAIGDGISAIANMATVGAGADSMYNPADSHHAKIKSKWDEIKAKKEAEAMARNKANMELLLKQYEFGMKAKEAEANRNFNIWKTETEEAGRNKRAENQQKFDAEQNKLKNDTSLQVAKIRGRSGGGSGSSSTGKYFFNGQAFRSASERNQAILNAAKKYQYDVYDYNDNLRDWDVMAVELEELMAEGESQPQVGTYASRWGSMFGKTSTSTPKSNNNTQPKTTENKTKTTMSIYG